ncbi:MAG: DUF3618 domain-containing protein [Leucobacter sp.]
MNAEDKRQGIADAARARAELYDTLGQLQERLNYAQRVDDAVDEARERVATAKRERPGAFFAGVAGVSLAAGLVAWGVASAILRRFNV